MNQLLKNITKSEVLELKNEVSYLEHQVVSKTLVQNPFVSMTLFAFDKNEEISSHESRGDAFVYCLDGIGEITIDDQKYEIKEGDTIVMPAKHPHAVYGKEKFKMLLVVVFPVKEV
ncbi:MAG: cupin domain-containing protein [Anaerocolumna sp.]